MPKNNNQQNNVKVERQLAVNLAALALFLGFFIGAFFTVLFNIGTKDGANSDEQQQINYKFPEGEYYDTRYLDSVINVFEEKYIDDFSVDPDKYTYGMVKGFIDSLDDKYTTFLDPEETKEYKSQQTGDFEGIGVVLGYDGSLVYIETVMKDHPAESAGILVGDYIIKINGEDATELLPFEVAQKVRGEKGTKVELAILREGVGELNVEIERGVIEVDNVGWSVIDEDTVKIDIIQFVDETPLIFNQSWDNLVDQIETEYGDNLANVVLDLRGNPGGYVAGAIHIAEEFLDTDEVILGERKKGEPEVYYYDERKGAFEDKEVVILVDAGSGSASEILTAALQENDKATVVGEPTVGKGVEQDVIEFEDGSLLLIVFQEWLTPEGRRVTPEESINPDHLVEFDLEAYREGVDESLDKALEILE